MAVRTAVFKSSGFTLIELLLVIALMGVLAGFAVPTSRQLLVRNNLDVADYTARQTIRRAQHLAHSGARDSNWGTYIEPGQVVMYLGNSYATRDNSFDEVYAVSDSLIVSGDQDLNFSKIYGLLDADANLQLTDVLGNSRTIDVTARGVVQ